MGTLAYPVLTRLNAVGSIRARRGVFGKILEYRPLFNDIEGLPFTENLEGREISGFISFLGSYSER